MEIMSVVCREMIFAYLFHVLISYHLKPGFSITYQNSRGAASQLNCFVRA